MPVIGGPVAGAAKLVETAAKTAAYTAVVGDLVLADTTGGLVPVALPSAAQVGDQVGVNVPTGTNPLVVSAAAGDVVGGGTDTAFALPVRGRTVVLQKATGGRWRFLDGAEFVQMIAIAADFTGTDGAAWDTTKFTQVASPTGGAGAAIQSNRGLLTTNRTGGYATADTSEMRVNTTAVPVTTADSEQLVSFSLSTTGEMYPNIRARVTTGNYYSAVMAPNMLTIQKSVSGSFTNIIQLPVTYTPGLRYWLRFRLVGPYIAAKTWANGAAEPELWTATATDASLTAGYCGLGIAGGATANGVGTGDFVDFDDYAVYTTIPPSPILADPTNRGILQERGTGREWLLRSRSSVSAFPVPTFRAAPGIPIAMDVMPGPGATESAGEGFAWFDVCDRDCLDTNGPVNTVRLGARSDRMEIGSRSYNGATTRPLHLTSNGTTFLQANAAGTGVGFLGATPVTRRTLSAAATDAATTQTLANSLRQALIDLGLGA